MSHQSDKRKASITWMSPQAEEKKEKKEKKEPSK